MACPGDHWFRLLWLQVKTTTLADADQFLRIRSHQKAEWGRPVGHVITAIFINAGQDLDVDLWQFPGIGGFEGVTTGLYGDLLHQFLVARPFRVLDTKRNSIDSPAFADEVLHFTSCCLGGYFATWPSLVRGSYTR